MSIYVNISIKCADFGTTSSTENGIVSPKTHRKALIPFATVSYTIGSNNTTTMNIVGAQLAENFEFDFLFIENLTIFSSSSTSRLHTLFEISMRFWPNMSKYVQISMKYVYFSTTSSTEIRIVAPKRIKTYPFLLRQLATI